MWVWHVLYLLTATPIQKWYQYSWHRLYALTTKFPKNWRGHNPRSHLNGFIHDLKSFGEGYVANSTETILKIVPQDNLIAIIDINTSDIGFVKIGKEVDLSIDSFPAKDFGSLKGNISQISSSAL